MMVLSPKRDPEISVVEQKDKEFAKRLQLAIEGHPAAPDGHGRQKWLRDRMREITAVDVSPEAVRKWFAGIARLRPSIMSEIARVLEVDEAWLSLGISPAESPVKAAERNAVAQGSVNVMAGLIQMHGGHIAFPDNDEEGVDIHAIIGGKRLQVEVKMPVPASDGTMKLTVAKGYEKRVVLALVTEKPFSIRIFRVPNDRIAAGRRRGGYTEIPADLSSLPEITSFANLDGNLSAGRSNPLTVK